MKKINKRSIYEQPQVEKFMLAPYDVVAASDLLDENLAAWVSDWNS